MTMELPVDYNKLHWTERKEVREEYVRQQDGNCYHCGAPLLLKPASDVRDLKVTPRLYPKGFFNAPIHLHHCHNTGMTIGAVHAHCNAVLWEYHGE